MALDLNSTLIGITCLECGDKVSETIENIKKSITITCRSRDCRTKIELNADNFKKEINEIEMSIQKIRNILKKL